MTPQFLAWLIDNWVRCEPFIQRAVDRANGSFDINHAWSEIMRGNAQFWPGERSAVITKIEVHPSGIKSVLGWLTGGEDLEEIAALEARISTWAKNTMGCTRAEIIGRRGWMRALDGYRENATLLVKDL